VKIGDALYELVDGDSDGNGFPDRVREWPVAKVTERFVFVHHPNHVPGERRAYRFDRAELERDGRGFHPRVFADLHVRPGVDWPLMVISVSAPQPKAVGAGEGAA
jgi:hypothetical protein